MLNGLSDHDAQILIMYYLNIQNTRDYHYSKRLINGSTITEFKTNLSYVSWDEIFTEDSVDIIFNKFL